VFILSQNTFEGKKYIFKNPLPAHPPMSVKHLGPVPFPTEKNLLLYFESSLVCFADYFLFIKTQFIGDKSDLR
jgi:hypothetical protein